MGAVGEAVVEILKLYELHPTWTNTDAIESRARVYVSALDAMGKIFGDRKDIKKAVKRIKRDLK